MSCNVCERLRRTHWFPPEIWGLVLEWLVDPNVHRYWSIEPTLDPFHVDTEELKILVQYRWAKEEDLMECMVCLGQLKQLTKTTAPFALKHNLIMKLKMKRFQKRPFVTASNEIFRTISLQTFDRCMKRVRMNDVEVFRAIVHENRTDLWESFRTKYRKFQIVKFDMGPTTSYDMLMLIHKEFSLFGHCREIEDSISHIYNKVSFQYLIKHRGLKWVQDNRWCHGSRLTDDAQELLHGPYYRPTVIHDPATLNRLLPLPQTYLKQLMNYSVQDKNREMVMALATLLQTKEYDIWFEPRGVYTLGELIRYPLISSRPRFLYDTLMENTQTWYFDANTIDRYTLNPFLQFMLRAARKR